MNVLFIVELLTNSLNDNKPTNIAKERGSKIYTYVHSYSRWLITAC
jgi:hypothetical protein